jgi:hypothetical protein
MTVTFGLMAVLALLLAADAWTLSLSIELRSTTPDHMLAWGQQRFGIAAALAVRAGLIFALAGLARLIAGQNGDWLILILCAGSMLVVWKRLRLLART